MNASIIIICGLKAGVQYAPALQLPQFERQLTAQVRADNMSKGTFLRLVMLHITALEGGSNGGGDSPTDTNVHIDTPIRACSATAWREPRGC